jgi:hypothetical protein
VNFLVQWIFKKWILIFYFHFPVPSNQGSTVLKSKNKRKQCIFVVVAGKQKHDDILSSVYLLFDE